MTTLLVGLALFLGIHSIAIVAPEGRARLVAALGAGPWKGLYSLVALVGLILIVKGFMPARAASTTLYIPTAPMRAAALLLMLVAFPCLVAAYLPGRLQTALRHPMLVATQAWALAHLLANGSSADALLFGGVLVWAGIEQASLQRRPPRPLPMAPATRYNDALALVLGVALYAAFLGGVHRALFGVAPLG